MSDSIYSPPAADLAPPPTDGPRYYVVSRSKFLLLGLLTMAAYSSYWVYRNWRQIKLADSRNIWPIPRGIFSVFFVHSLFADVDRNLEKQGIDHAWSPVAWATAFVVLAVSGTITGQLIGRGLLPYWTYLVIFFLPLLYTVALLPGQKAANIASGDARGTTNAHLTPANWFWMAAGALLWILNGIGLWFASSTLASLNG